MATSRKDFKAARKAILDKQINMIYSFIDKMLADGWRKTGFKLDLYSEQEEEYTYRGLEERFAATEWKDVKLDMTREWNDRWNFEMKED
jgi:hypothetical protein